MIDKKQLCEFLVKAKRATYASGAEAINEKDQSRTLIFEEGDFRYHDNYFGGEPFGGREVVFFKNNPVYIMTYYGLVDLACSDFETVYKMLKKALMLIPADYPFRGPENLEDNGWVYKNNYNGEVNNFFGEEIIISPEGQEVYTGRYAGGFVCQK